MTALGNRNKQSKQEHRLSSRFLFHVINGRVLIVLITGTVYQQNLGSSIYVIAGYPSGDGVSFLSRSEDYFLRDRFPTSSGIRPFSSSGFWSSFPADTLFQNEAKFSCTYGIEFGILICYDIFNCNWVATRWQQYVVLQTHSPLTL